MSEACKMASKFFKDLSELFEGASGKKSYYLTLWGLLGELCRRKGFSLGTLVKQKEQLKEQSINKKKRQSLIKSQKSQRVTMALLYLIITLNHTRKKRRRRVRMIKKMQKGSKSPYQHICSTITIEDQFSDKNTHVNFIYLIFRVDPP